MIFNKDFTLTERGESMIRELPSPFGVISVAGMYRTGKSYLLNRMLLNRSNGFSVGPTINPCTKGLWMWSKPIYNVSDDESDESNKMPLILIDTEGFGSFDEDQNHDVRIFSIAILLSSFFVYNSVGNIDENTIQSLSFVINLTNHIKTKATDEKSDPEELASIFPAFLWVLRDFSLKLVNEKNEVMSAKDYLEDVLGFQKSLDQNDPKNKIRSLIKTYFKERDCYTLIRPLIGEDQLQNLDKVPFDSLRPEFINQVLGLRKRVLSSVKPKTLKGNYLNGEMFLNTIKIYIDSINTGVVPNIENTWNSICRVESLKSMENAEKSYEENLKEHFRNNSMDEIALNEKHKQAKKKAIELFKSKSLGEIGIEFENLLLVRIKEKFNFYKQINQEETKNSLMKLLQKHYSVLEYKIHNNDLKNVSVIENEFKSIDEQVRNHFSNFKLKEEILNNFKYKVMSFANEFFLSTFNNEIIILNSKIEDIKSKYNLELIEIKQTSENELNRKKTQIEGIKTELLECKMTINNLKESMLLIQNEKDEQQLNFKEKMLRLKEDYESSLLDLQNKVGVSEEKQIQSERNLMTFKSEMEKQKALYEQKIDHYVRQIEDYSKREKESVIELRSQIKEQQMAFRENNNKHEVVIKDLTQQIELFKEKLIDYEGIIASKDSTIESEKARAEEVIFKSNLDLEDMREKLNGLKNKFDSEKNKINEEAKVKEAEFIKKSGLLKIRCEEMELTLKNSQEQHKSIVDSLERELAVLKQNNEFLELQLKESKEQLEEEKRSHENILSSLEIKSFQGEEHSKQIEELKILFSNEKKSFEEKLEKSKLLYLSQIDLLNEKNNELECKSKITNEENMKEISEIKIKFERLSREYEKLLKDFHDQNMNLENNSEENQNKLRNLTKEYDKKLEEKERMYQKELSELIKSSEVSVSQLKSIFESEKIRFEEKLRDERLKNDRKHKQTVDEYENKLKELENELRDELENVNQDLQDALQNQSIYAQKAEMEFSNFQQKIESLEIQLRDKNELMDKLQNQSNFMLERESESHKKDRNHLVAKIETLSSEINNKEKEISTLRLKKDQLEFVVNEKENNLILLRKEFEEEKKELIGKIESFKSKLQSTNDDFMMKKLENARETALLKQQIEFQDKKIDELNRNIEDGQKRYEEKLFSLRNEVERDLQEKYDRIKRDRDDFETKYLGKKKEMRELEQNYIKQSSLAEKEKAILSEKNTTLEQKRKELIDNYEKELENLTINLRTLKEEKMNEIEGYLKELEDSKKKLNNLDQLFNERNTAYEKDKILWEGRFKFLESQRDQCKKELSDNQKKFEAIVENIQKRSIQEIEKYEANNAAMVNNLEQKYQYEIKCLKENHAKLYSDLLNLNKDLERELKALNLQQELRGKSLDPSAISKRISELLETQDRMKKEIDMLRKEKDQKIGDITNMCEREKEILKLKIVDVENRLREVEARRGQLMLDYEKEKAKASLEHDHMESKNKGLQETLDRLEKKIESLLRENEKLKNEKGTKRNVSQNNIKNPNFQGNNNLINSNLMSSNNNLNSTFLNNLGSDNMDNSQFNPNRNFNPYSSINNPFAGVERSINFNDQLNTSNNTSGVVYNKSHKFSVRQMTKKDQNKEDK